MQATILEKKNKVVILCFGMGGNQAAPAANFKQHMKLLPDAASSSIFEQDIADAHPHRGMYRKSLSVPRTYTLTHVHAWVPLAGTDTAGPSLMPGLAPLSWMPRMR